MAELTAALPVLRNVWHRTSVENAGYLDRIDDLRRVRSAVRFISFEPLIGSVAGADLNGISWGNRRWREWAWGTADEAGLILDITQPHVNNFRG